MTYSAVLPTAIAFVWAGVATGGSLIGAPAKFQAPSLDLPTAIEVGRVTFRWVGTAEAVLAGLLVAAVTWLRPEGRWLVTVPLGMFALQWVGVIPVLDGQARSVIAGNGPARSFWHLAYIVLELGKVASLL